MKQNCYIVRDLMGNYIEELVSEETAADIREHLNECEECSRLHTRLSEPVCKEDIVSEDERKENEKKVEPLKKFRRGKKVLMIILIALAGICVFYTILFSSFMVMISSGGSEVTEVEEYAEVLGESGDNKDNYIGYNDIFPNIIPDSADVSMFNSTCKAGIDDHYLSYLVYTCSDSDYAEEYDRLSGLESTDYNVYGTKGFNEKYELCAVYASEYGIIYALTDRDANEFVYVAMEFTDYLYDIDYESIVAPEHLPIGFYAGEGNPTRQAFDEEYDPFSW